MNISLPPTLKAAINKMAILVLLKTQVEARPNDTGDADAQIIAKLDQFNGQLSKSNAIFRLHSIGLYATEESAEMGRLVYASNRGNKQLTTHWVPNDDRRNWNSPGDPQISFINDLFDGTTATDLMSSETEGAIGRAMQTWKDVTCSDMHLVDFGSHDFDFGYVQYLLGFGGSLDVFADITHGGFLPGAFFDSVFGGPGAGASIIGVAFTFVFDGESGYSDIDNNGKADTALVEIYYNNDFPWNIDGNFDVETVALHEAGHALSQGHFGDIFRTPSGKLKFAPRAVMNAAYTGVQQELTGTDKAGHCSIWASWPSN